MENFIKLSKSNNRFNVEHIERYRPADINWAGVSGWYVKIETISGVCDIEYNTESERDNAISRLDVYFKVAPL